MENLSVMNVTFCVNNFSTIKNTNKRNTNNNSSNIVPSFKGTDGLTPEQAAALAGQRINKKPSVPHITEKDINFEVTCFGYSQVKGNTREIYDYRCAMRSIYGLDWYKNFKKPYIVRNGNLDEKVNGETTAIVFPLNPATPGIRGADHMAMVLNGRIEQPLLNELVTYMAKVGILNTTPIAGITYYVNSKNPKEFMANPKIKTAIASFFQTKAAEKTNEANISDEKLKTSDINIVNIGQKQDKNNTHAVKDYLREYLSNGKKFTVLHDKFTKNGIEKDLTVILIPSTKSDWDCITLTIDKRLAEEECKNLLNYLVRNKMANVENENFRTAIVEYFNK